MIIPLNPPIVVSSSISSIRIDELNIRTELFNTTPIDTDIVATVNYIWLDDSSINKVIKTNTMNITRAQLVTICSASGVSIDNLVANLNTIIVAFAKQTGKI